MIEAEQPRHNLEPSAPVRELSSETAAPSGEESERPVRAALRRLGCAIRDLLRRSHILDPDVWLRILLMAICALLFFVLFVWLIWFLVLFQTLYTLISGHPNRDLVKFAPKCGNYARDLLAFLTYADEQRPWPFSSFKESDLPTEAPREKEKEKRSPASSRAKRK